MTKYKITEPAHSFMYPPSHLRVTRHLVDTARVLGLVTWYYSQGDHALGSGDGRFFGFGIGAAGSAFTDRGHNVLHSQRGPENAAAIRVSNTLGLTQLTI